MDCIYLLLAFSFRFFFFLNRIYRDKLGRDTRNAADNAVVAVVFNDVYIVRKYL